MTRTDDAVERLAQALGGGAAAALAAAALIEAELIGQPRFGFDMLAEWSPDNAPPPEADPARPVQWLDCRDSFAPLAVAQAVLCLGAAARRNGVAVIFLRGVRGFGRLAPFVRHLADAGLLAMAGAEGPPFVAPWQGDRPVVGTNPFALAFGTGDNRVVIDIASSATTMAALRTARATGEALPAGIALDAGGAPTRIAAEVAALLPRGGQIGSLLGLIVEILAGVAGGGRGDPRGRGVFLLALDPGAHDAPDWQARLAALKADWNGAGGHWPGRFALSPDSPLPAAVDERLASHLARLSGPHAETADRAK